MTWYLRRLEREDDEVTPQPVPVPTRPAQFGAAFSEFGIQENARFYRQRKANSRLNAMVDQLGGLDAIAPRDADDQAALGARDIARPRAGDQWQDQWSALPADRKVDYLTRRASLALQRDPARFGNIPVTAEQFQEQLVQEMQDELAEAQEVLGAGDNPVVQFLGGLASAATDEISLPLLALGGVSFPIRQTGRFVAQEMLIGAAAEVAALPRAQQQAALMELQDPNVWERIGTGAAVGGLFGGVLSGGARGVDYLRMRSRAEGEARPAGMDGPEHQLRVDLEEQRLRTGQETPVERAATQSGAVDTSQPMILGITGAGDARTAMIRMPDGSVISGVRPGDTLADGSTVQSIANDQITILRDGETVSADVGETLAGVARVADAAPEAVREFTGVAQAGAGFTVVLDANGQAIRREGTRAWRNNNPGNIEFGNFARAQGAVGTDGRFAVFPTYEAGRRAKEALLWETGSYRGMTINQAIHRYAPPFENNTAAYVNSVARAVGVAADTPMSALTPAQRQTMLDAMERVEGFKPGRENGVQVAGSGRATAAAQAESGINLGTSRPMTRFDEVTTPAGMRVPVDYQVVDLDSLMPARAEFQPRDRTRGASDEQISEIAARLDALRLMPSPEADRGAPIIGPDMMVESGNGRVMALRRAADQHPDRYGAYVEAIRAQGFDVPEGMTRPALVAMRRGDMTPEQRRQFVTEANDSGTMRMAASEQAGRDADFLSGNVFDAYQPGVPISNQGEFLRRLLGRMPQSERAAMYDATGRLSADGLRRVRQALFARAYDAPDLLRMLAESPDPKMRAMLDMLDDLAPDWAAFRAAVEAGFVRPEFDITDAMTDIVRTIARARNEGRDGQSVIAAIRDKLAQVDMFAARDDALAEALLGTFYKGKLARRPADAGDILRRYIAEAQTVGRADADDLFGPVAPSEVLRNAITNHEARADYTQAPARVQDVSVPDTRDVVAAPMLDGAESPVLIRATEATEAEIRAAVKGDDVQAQMAEARARIASRDAEVQRLSADAAPVRMQGADADQRALVSQSPDQPGRWRLTYLDRSGPVGHSDFDTKADALRRALEENFAAVSPEPAPVARATEATPAGEQTLIPGVEPITQRQRLEADMARPVTGRDAGPGSGRDDLFGNPEDRRDLFDAPARRADGPSRDPAPAPAGQGDMAAADAATGEFAALRDLTVRLEENGPDIRVSDILDDLDANAEFAAVVQVCTTGRGR